MPAGTHQVDQQRRPTEQAALIDAVRSLPERFRTLFTGLSLETPLENRSRQRPSLHAPTAVEHLICVREALEDAGNLIERVAHDARPVPVRARVAEPIGGYNRWRPEELLSGLAAESERLARIMGDLTNDGSLPEDVRVGLQLIAGELLRQIMGDATAHLSEAGFAMRA